MAVGVVTVNSNLLRWVQIVNIIVLSSKLPDEKTKMNNNNIARTKKIKKERKKPRAWEKLKKKKKS